MKRSKLLPAVFEAATLAVAVIGGMLISSLRAHADEESEIQTGFDIAPVTLNLQGKNHDLVGLGSYIVNAHGLCNVCP